MCNKNAIGDEYHFTLECDEYNNLRCKYIESYYFKRPSTFKLVQILSVRNNKEVNNLGKYLYSAQKALNVFKIVQKFVYYVCMLKKFTLLQSFNIFHTFIIHVILFCI